MIDSEISEIEISNTLSMSSFMPPEWAHSSGLASANCLTVSTAAFLNYSSASSAKEINEFARNLGKLTGDTSIHLLINLML